jgi:hypothetical protein
MGLKAFGARWFSKYIVRQHCKWRRQAIHYQRKNFQYLLQQGRKTQFGADHNFDSIQSYEDFKKQVPIRNYESIRPYIEQIKAGKSDVLWPGSPLYFSKTAGTTSGSKLIPITKASIPYHIKSARDATLMYTYQKGDASLFDGKMIFLSGNPELKKVNGILTGRLSGIVHHHVPKWVQNNRLPTWETNCIEDWEEKLDKIIDETLIADMRLISGIPPWVQMYLDRVEERTGQKMKEIWPNLQLVVHGGVNFRPYRNKMSNSLGEGVDFLETYPASEGFIAYQDMLESEQNGLLLLPNHGIFYEFVPADEIFDSDPTRLSLEQVEIGRQYAIILNTNAGLWGYNIGDTVKFVSKSPPRIRVTGRIKHFISAFGEHVIAEEVETALKETAQEHGVEVVEFTVAPQVKKQEGEDSYHEWFIEFGVQQPDRLEHFAREIDQKVQQQNDYYKDLVQGNILTPLRISVVEKGGFQQYMKSVGQLGGQNKVPRLSNDRHIADKLNQWVKTAAQSK